MGHYCKICGRTRANEKFSGRGHKNHVCKDCSSKSRRKVKMTALNETILDLETFMPPDTAYIQCENIYYDDSWIYEADFEDGDSEDEKGEELPF